MAKRKLDPELCEAALDLLDGMIGRLEEASDETIEDILKELKELSPKDNLYIIVSKIRETKYQINIFRISDFNKETRLSVLRGYSQDLDNVFNYTTLIILENSSHWINGRQASQFDIVKEFKS